jgi:hypothetical protein
MIKAQEDNARQEGTKTKGYGLKVIRASQLHLSELPTLSFLGNGKCFSSAMYTQGEPKSKFTDNSHSSLLLTDSAERKGQRTRP